MERLFFMPFLCLMPKEGITTLSPAQLAANTANAPRSTGPRTPEGKAISSKNACKHGLTSRDVVVDPEDRPEFDQLLDSYSKELHPVGQLEQDLFQQFILAAWNLRRIRRIRRLQSLRNVGVVNPSLDPLLDPSLDTHHDRLSRYHTRFERTFSRTLKLLKELQTDRVLRDAIATGKAEVPRLISISDFAKRTQEKDLPGRRDTIQLVVCRPWDAPAAPKTAFDAPPQTLEVPAAA